MSRFRVYREKTSLSIFFRIYDFVMEKLGLFEIKSKIKQHFLYFTLRVEDAKKKKRIRKKLLSFPNNYLHISKPTNDFIVSVTSYGKRVTTALPYALYSLLSQKKLPSQIVVFLDKDHWSDSNLPSVLRTLKNKGILFCYCDDIRSYTKLIPALKLFPDNPIITVDDDFYYNSEMISIFEDQYTKSDKITVLGHWGLVPSKVNGLYAPYNNWKDCSHYPNPTEVSLIGCCGCLYPPHIFDEEILKSDIFMRLCPTADDIWLWIMEKRQNIKVQLIQPIGYGTHTPVNRIEEYDLSQTGTLMYQNVRMGKNNIQLKNLLSYYNLE